MNLTLDETGVDYPGWLTVPWLPDSFGAATYGATTNRAIRNSAL